MLFTIAQSAAPTRVPSPEGRSDAGVQSREPERAFMRPVLSNARRIEYLKNYVGQVAPWVGTLGHLWDDVSPKFVENDH